MFQYPTNLERGTLFLSFCLNSALLYSLRCLVFPGVIWFSSSRYGGRPAGTQHTPCHSEAQLSVEARHEHFTGCPGTPGWPGQGKASTTEIYYTDIFYFFNLKPFYIEIVQFFFFFTTKTYLKL